MNDAQVEQIIRQYLPQIIHMSMATCVDTKPWVYEVHFAYDDDLNLYWVSDQTRRHSQELLQNNRVSGNIVTQHHLGQAARGVAFEGVAGIVDTLDEAHPGYGAYKMRYADKDLLQAYSDPNGARLYEIKVSDYYLLDAITTGKLVKHHLVRSAQT